MARNIRPTHAQYLQMLEFVKQAFASNAPADVPAAVKVLQASLPFPISASSTGSVLQLAGIKTQFQANREAAEARRKQAAARRAEREAAKLQKAQRVADLKPLGGATRIDGLEQRVALLQARLDSIEQCLRELGWQQCIPTDGEQALHS